MNVFNLNLTYLCNNQCRLCISHHTRELTERIMPVGIIHELIQHYTPNKEDLFILSGGEPTLTPFFYDILEELSTVPSKKILYTNGRTLRNTVFASFTCAHIDKIIISLYGNKSIHNYYANNASAFDDTMSGIQNVIQLKPRYRSLKVEVKLICNKKIVDENLNIFSFLDLDSIIKNIDCLIFARLLQRIKPSLLEMQYIHDWVSQQIDLCHNSFANTPIKLVDLWPCLFNNKLYSEISQSRIEKEFIDVLFFDAVNPQGKKLEYVNSYKANQLNACSNCFANTFCGNSITCFGALCKESDQPWVHVPE